MKNSRGSSLYEVLKNASRPSGSPDGVVPAPSEQPAPQAPVASLQERLAAYKAAQLAAAQQPSGEVAAAAVATAPLERSAPTIVLTPEPTPPPLPAITAVHKATPKMELLEPLPTPLSTPLRASQPAPAFPDSTRLASASGPGERVLRVTYNTAAFATLIVVGLVFISYAVGMHLGKASAAGEAQIPSHRPPVQAVVPVPVAVAPPAPVPVAPKREFTLRLTEWKYGSSQERLKANAAADDLKRALDRAGHKGAEKAVVKRGEELRLALYLGQFTELNSEATRAKLATIKAFKVQNMTPFSLAVFEEAPK